MAGERSPLGASPAAPPSEDGPAPPGPFGTLESDLADLEAKLDSDLSRDGALAAFHRLLALISLANLRLSSGPPLPSSPAGARDTGPAPASAPGTTAPAKSLGSAEGAATGPVPGVEAHLGAIAAALHRIVAIVAERVGATGYSIGVSLPAGLSITVDFTLPRAAAGGRPATRGT